MTTELTFWTAPQICSRYGVTSVTLRKWIGDGEFPTPVIIKNRRYFDCSEVRAWEDELKRRAAELLTTH